MDEPVVNERERQHAEALARQGVPIQTYWFDQNALLSLLFNAASVTIPNAERFVIRTAQATAPFLPAPEHQEKIKNIVHEETAHANVHDAYNSYLKKQGFPVEKYAAKIQRASIFFERHCSLRTRLAMCAAIEHFTACGARQVLDVGLFEGRGVDERMDRVWTWHALEELDHRSTIFDLYLALKGSYLQRVWAGLIVSAVVLYIHHACVFSLMRQRGVLWSPRAWKLGSPLLFGKRGVYRHFFPDWLRFYRPSFHPESLLIRNTFKKQLHHYHIESELIKYFSTAPAVKM